MEPASRGRIIAFRADRLGARLVSLMNAMRLAEIANTDFACAWTETTGVGDIFNDPSELFDASFVDRHFLPADAWKTARPKAEIWRIAQNDTETDLRGIVDQGQDLIVGNAFGVITVRGEDATAAVDGFRAQLGRIPFSAPVAEAMRAADAALVGCTAYHIRRGDLTDDLKAMNKAWPHKMVPNEFYEIHMRERLAASGGVVLFSDDPETVAHYCAAFPSIKMVADVIETGDLTEAQRDLVELYAMARCETIIAPARSAFSSTAADLFGATKLPIADALGPHLSEQAHQALLTRLETEPERFSGDGDIGQSLAHVGDWLEKHQRWLDAARVFSGHVQRGLAISFVYPRTMTYQHRVGDIPGVLSTAEAMAARHVVHSKDLVNATILHGYAHLRGGDRQAGLKHIANGFWIDPGSGLARNLIPVLVEAGWLNDRNFLPVTPLQRTIGRRRGLVKSLHRDLPGIEELEGLNLPESVGRLETMIWDWAPLLASVSMNAAVRNGAIAQVIDVLERAKASPELTVELEGQKAILRAFLGEFDSAGSQLSELASQNSDNWLLWQRLSHVHWLKRDDALALAAAERAVEVLPDSPALRAWAGMVGLRARKVAAAVDNLRLAHEADTGLATFSSLYAQALRQHREPEAALAVIQGARCLMPADIRAAMLEAELLDQAGRADEAIDVLQKLVDWQRATARVFMMLVRLLQESGAAERAAEAAGIGAERFPKHPGIVALGHQLAA